MTGRGWTFLLLISKIYSSQSVKDVFFQTKKFHKDEEVAACDFTSLLTRMCRHE